MTRPDWVPEDVDMQAASPARMYDALLGGTHNFEVDRQAAARAVAMVPDLADVAVSNRAFLRRAVRFLVAAGVHQFIDLGAGIPGVGSTHEVAQQADARCRVVYVDIDPVAVAHGEAILAGNDRAVALAGDVLRPGLIMDDPKLHEMIDLDRPVAVLLVAVLHLIPGMDETRRVVATIRDRVITGSYIAISHLSNEYRPEDASKLAANSRRTGVPITFRSRTQVEEFFTGLTLVEPGVVALPRWRPESAADITEEPERSLGLAGIGCKH